MELVYIIAIGTSVYILFDMLDRHITGELLHELTEKVILLNDKIETLKKEKSELEKKLNVLENKMKKRD